jgi:hypothetical protein
MSLGAGKYDPVACAASKAIGPENIFDSGYDMERSRQTKTADARR